MSRMCLRRKDSARYVFVVYQTSRHNPVACFHRYRWRAKQHGFWKHAPGYVITVEKFDLWRSRGWRSYIGITWEHS